MEKYSRIPKYDECPERIEFFCQKDSTAKSKFIEAMKSDKLRYQFDGAIRTLIQKGEQGIVYVRPINNPLKDITDAHFFLSAHNNYHIGEFAGERFNHSDIVKYNLGNYSYFQDEKYFLAIKKLYVEEEKEIYVLYINKKKIPKDTLTE